MSLNAQIIITGDKETIAKLSKMGTKIVNLKSAMDDIGDELTRYYSTTVFNSRGSVYGKKWAPLSKVTLYLRGVGKDFDDESQIVFANFLLNKKAQSGGRSGSLGSTTGAVLEDTGTMKKSFEYESTKNSVTIGNTAEYFKYHQSSAARKKLPRRQMIGINNDVKSIIKQIIDKDINTKIKQAGF